LAGARERAGLAASPSAACGPSGLIEQANSGHKLDTIDVFKHMGLKGKIYDLTTTQRPVSFTDDVKSEIFLRHGVKQILECPICGGFLDVSKSVSYDHITRVREGGVGAVENGQLVHPYCNSLRG
jgi:hypothetical protein